MIPTVVSDYTALPAVFGSIFLNLRMTVTHVSVPCFLPCRWRACWHRPPFQTRVPAAGDEGEKQSDEGEQKEPRAGESYTPAHTYVSQQEQLTPCRGQCVSPAHTTRDQCVLIVLHIPPEGSVLVLHIPPEISVLVLHRPPEISVLVLHIPPEGSVS